MLEACRTGETKVVQLLLERYNSEESVLNIFESIDTPGLIICMEVSDTWRELMAKYVLMQRWKGKMFEACKNGQTKVVQLLLEFYNSEESGLNRRDFFGRTTLMIACKNGHTDVVQLLLDNSEGDIDLNTRTYLGWTALMYACSSGQKDIVQLLLDKRNIDLNAMNHFGGTALIIACENGDKDIVQLLLNNSYMNIDLNARDDTGKTALMWTYQRGCKDVVKLLVVERGCSERSESPAGRPRKRRTSVTHCIAAERPRKRRISATAAGRPHKRRISATHCCR